ncbi:isoprenoid synthase domain-containing protein [Lophiotrema nucula]|uniref:Terpene synthase n=1 Tax=Lophiotrema nucula TaxID=690887 RepID=A0A6A5Z495_9PLEO|nr:isoprenoid synthase domain-containing protein [Lophiotrema nucula]
MNYQYSTLVDASAYETEGLCEGIPLRIHRYAELEEIGSFRAQEDWRKHVGPLTNFKGGLGPMYSFMAVSVPECLPERLEILSYANEFAFLHDDITDNASEEKILTENDDMLQTFRKVARSQNIPPDTTGKRYMQSRILLDMLALDHERALTTIKSWATFVKTASGCQHHKHFETLDDYLPYRSIDVGQMFWHGMVTFGMALTIPEAEMPLCETLMKPAWIAASLTNDLFSWEKERQAAADNGQKDVVNAVWVAMKEHSFSVNEAKAFCRKRIKECVADYLHIVQRSREDTTISLDLRKYIEAMQYSLSGNVAWSLQCPRYHADIAYNQVQQLREKYGVASYPARQQRVTRKGVALAALI